MAHSLKKFIYASNQHVIEKAINDRKYLEELETEYTKETNGFLKYLTDLTKLRVVGHGSENSDDENEKDRWRYITPILDLSLLSNLKILVLDTDYSTKSVITHPDNKLEVLVLDSHNTKMIDLQNLTNLTKLKIHVYSDNEKINLKKLTNLKSLHIGTHEYKNMILPSPNNISELELDEIDNADFRLYPNLKKLIVWKNRATRGVSFEINKKLEMVVCNERKHYINDINRNNFILKQDGQ